MHPAITVPDAIDSSFADAIDIAHSLTANYIGQTTNILDILVGELGSAIAFASGMWTQSVHANASGLSALSHLVRRVVLSRAKKEVPWVTARRIVAGVQHLQLVGNVAVEYDPDGSVRSLVSAIEPEATVAVGIAVGCPLPTSIRRTMGDLLPNILWPVASHIAYSASSMPITQ